MKVIEPVANLGAHLRPLRAHLVGLPQDLDLAGELRVDLGGLFPAEPRVVQPFAEQEQSSQALHQRAPARLGRVSGEHRHVHEPVEQFLHVLGRHALCIKPAQRLVERSAPQRPAGAHPAPAHAVVVEFLGGIDEREEHAEGAHHVREHLGIELVDQAHQPRAALRIVLLVQGNKAPSQCLDRFVHLAADLGVQHLPEQAPEELYPRAQVLVVGRVAGIRYRCVHEAWLCCASARGICGQRH
jgi:hypothetical protein